jgi:hypothetical protein
MVVLVVVMLLLASHGHSQVPSGTSELVDVRELAAAVSRGQLDTKAVDRLVRASIERSVASSDEAERKTHAANAAVLADFDWARGPYGWHRREDLSQDPLLPCSSGTADVLQRAWSNWLVVAVAGGEDPWVVSPYSLVGVEAPWEAREASGWEIARLEILERCNQGTVVGAIASWILSYSRSINDWLSPLRTWHESVAAAAATGEPVEEEALRIVRSELAETIRWNIRDGVWTGFRSIIQQYHYAHGDYPSGIGDGTVSGYPAS